MDTLSRLIFHLRDCAKDCRHRLIMVLKDQTKPEENAEANRSHEMCWTVTSRGWLNFLTSDRDQISPFDRDFWEDERSTATVSFISHPLNYFQNRVPIYPHLCWVFGKDTCVKLCNSTSILQRVYPRREFYRVAQNTCMCMFHMCIYIVQINVLAPYVHRTRT